MKNSLAPKYHGLYDVVEVRMPVITVLREGVPVTVNVDRVKPAFYFRDLDEHFPQQEDDVEMTYIQRAEQSYRMSIIEKVEDLSGQHYNPTANG